jgi:cytochrome c-type biogenesis protein CcmE
MKSRHKRMMFIVVGLAGVAAVFALVLNALQSNINHFFSPTEVAANKAPADRTFRLGGLVEKGSLVREDDGLTVHFKVTDNIDTIMVTYTGILPDLFSEGQGMVAQGKLGTDGVFIADEVLAKHDEKYMPPEVAEALKKADKQKQTTVPQGGI